MAKFNYSGLAATAKRLIDRFGRDVTKRIVTNSGTDFDPTQSKVDTPLVGVFTTFSKNEIDGTLIKSTDKKMLTYDSAVLTDIILDNSIEYTIINIDTIETGDTKIIYKLQLRK